MKAAASLAGEKAAKAEAAASEIAEDAKQHIQALDKAKASASDKRRKDALKQAAAHREEALAAVREFHRKLCTLKVLDPACGSGNFLYVSLELMKRLEAEVLEAFEELGGDAGFEMASFKIGPRQFLGLEINRRAVAIAQLVLWIGFFQWQRKTTGKADTNERPLLPKDPSIVQQDAVLAYDEAIPRKDPDTGKTVTIWDGITTKPHPITGKEVPDDSARKVVFDYTNPRRAEWPAADVIVGNPPFLGSKKMNESFGDGYTSALQKTWAGLVPGAADFVFYWWQKAGGLVRDGHATRFGFITTNSLTQTTARAITKRFIEDPKNPIHLAYAIADHPWVDSSDGAAVRIAMTVCARGSGEGVLATVLAEIPSGEDSAAVETTEAKGVIGPNLKLGDSLTSTVPLKSNQKLCWQGCKLVGSGFQVSPAQGQALGFHGIDGTPVLKSYWAGSDLTKKRDPRFVIDFFGHDQQSAARFHPAAFQHVLVEVFPERAHNRDTGFREKWWLFGRPRPDLRAACEKIRRYIVTSEVAKHRTFMFLAWPDELIDGSVMAIASEDAYILGMLSSTVHVLWAVNCGGRMGIGNDPRYQTGPCFDPFPFPALEEGELKQRIRDLGERLDAHRKRQQELHPDLTLTGLYNVLEAVRAGRPLNAKEKAIHDKGLVSILRQIHDELDAAVFEAYGWQDLGRAWQAVTQDGHLFDLETGCEILVDLDPNADYGQMLDECREKIEQAILARLVALNQERAAEEKRGLIRWLRPEYQAPDSAALPVAEQKEIQLAAGTTAAKSANIPDKLAWPEGLSAQVAAIQQLIPALGPDPEAIAARFGKKSAKRSQQVGEILETLRGLGQL